MVWNMSTAIASSDGMVAHGKLKLLRAAMRLPQHIVYSSSSLAANYGRLSFPAGSVISLGVDTDRYKPDFAARKRVREQLQFGPKDFVIGMNAPFQPEYDYATFIKATAELIKYNPNVQVLIAGRGAQRGNAALMALLGGGTLASRTTLLGEWSDVSALFNACDVVCSSAINDSAAPMLAMAMLCGVQCVATGKGAQGEVLGQSGTAVEQGSPQSFVKAITRIIETPAEKRAFTAQAARNHALQNHSLARAVDKYTSLYLQLAVVTPAAMPHAEPQSPPR